MKNPLATLCLCLVWTTLFAQNTNSFDHQFRLDNGAIRQEIQLNNYEEIIRLCGLEIGETYQFWAIHFDGQQPVAGTPSQTEKSDFFTFTANEECEGIYFAKGNGMQTGPFHFSVACTTCERVDGAAESMANLQVIPGFTNEELIRDVFLESPCFIIENVEQIGSSEGISYFESGSASIGLERGILLQSGNVINALGPNDSNSAGNDIGGGSDPDLQQIATATVFNATGIEFDFVPNIEEIHFEFVFASEEYCEYVNSSFNDVFGFFLSGPSISGPYQNGAINIANLPTGAPVSINNVNHLINSGFFLPNQDNCGGFYNPNDIQFDGFTTELTAIATLIPGETYHIRLVVGDAGDGIFDSAVFLNANSFDIGDPSQPDIVSDAPICPTDSLTNCQKVCGNSTVVYEVENILDEYEVTWEVTGAQDFTQNENSVEVQWGASGNGEVTAIFEEETDIPIQVYCGQQNASPDPSSGTIGSAYFFADGIPVSPFQIVLSGPNSFSMVINDATNGPNYFPLPFEGNYTATAYDPTTNPPTPLAAPCEFDMVQVWQGCEFSVMPTNIYPPAGTIALTGYMGAPPYLFTWSLNGVPFLQTDNFVLTNLECGQYDIIATDLAGCETSISIEMPCTADTTCYLPATQCVEIVPIPKSYFTTTPEPGPAQPIEICQGQEVFFHNLSFNATDYVWHFGDTGTSTQAEPSHVYNEAGNYTAMLIARSDCFCADTSMVEVIVAPVDLPEIECVGSVCEGDAVDYTTSADCGTFIWEVSPNGNIIGGGGPADNFVTVEWVTGPDGYVSLQTFDCASVAECNFPNIRPIAIMSDNAEIEGPKKVCDGERAEYFIPDFLGSNIIWDVGPGGTIETGQGTNRVRILWDLMASGGAPQPVTVFYENCFLGCEGQDTLMVNIKNEFFINGDIQFCQNSNGEFRAQNAVTGALAFCDWQVFDEDDNPVWSSGSSGIVNVPLNFAAGQYTLRATSVSASSFCNETYDLPFRIFENPPPPGAIFGETQVCPGDPQTYTTIGVGSNSFEWTITDGANTSMMNGNPINTVWGFAAPRTLSVIQISANGLLCESEPTTLSMENLPDVSISGETGMCEETTGFYSATDLEQLDYQWFITPSYAGTVLNGQGSPYIEVQWNVAGAATLELVVCNQNKTFPVQIWAKPQPMVLDDAVCLGETTPVSTTIPFSNYLWKNETGLTISGAPSPNLSSGFYQVEVTDANGCLNHTSFEIGMHPQPDFNLSAPIYQGLCPTGPDATIQATTQTGGLTYQWVGPGGPLATTADHYTTNVPGTYVVTATNPEGCEETKFYPLFECPAPAICVDGSCTAAVCNNQCNSTGDVNLSISTTSDCSTHQYINQSTNYVPGSIVFRFHDNSTISTDGTASFSYNTPGYYPVLISGLVNEIGGGTCARGELVQDSILAVAKFESESACPGEPVLFTDVTEFLPSVSLIAFEWDFGDPASGAANTSTQQHPSHVYSNPGTYVVTLTVTTSSGCQTTTSQNVSLHALPQPHFTPQSSGCEDNAIPFTPDGAGNPVSFEWDFGDPVSALANTSDAMSPSHQFSSNGTFDITLTTTNIYGCFASFSDQMVIVENDLTGVITVNPASPICPGDLAILNASASEAVDFVWSTGAVTNTITSSSSGIYDVTMTDSDGCIFSPAPGVVDIFGEPNALIQAVVFNEYGQPVSYAQGSYEACEGEDVNLEMVGQNDYTYQWSTGDVDSTLVFSEEKDNLLSAGTYNFTVTVTDDETGCTSETSFQVIIHSTPAVEIASDPSGVLCENISASLFVTSPEPDVTYSWVTGETGTGITVVGGGEYFTVATSPEGCSTESNILEVRNSPGVHTVPIGCLTRCYSAEICLPELPDVVSYQWYLDGAPLPAPNGASPNPELTQSGDYQVVMTDAFGCTGESGTLSLTLEPGYGTLLGQVYFDVNGNGVVDAADTLVSGINLNLLEGSALVGSTTSNFEGQYAFANIPSTAYTIELDMASLPPGWQAILVSQNQALEGCDDEAETTWLLFQDCFPTSSEVELSACPGENATYAGTQILAGNSEIFTLENMAGCDSTVTVTVGLLPQANDIVNGEACEGSFFIYDGEEIAPGETAIFIETNPSGCADTTTVTVDELDNTSSVLGMSICPADSLNYAGTSIPAGSSEVFILENADGCDSIVTVNAIPLPTSTNFVIGEACDGGFFEYMGEMIPPNETVIFTETNPHGCPDSTVVTVAQLANTTDEVGLEACPGESALYNGTAIPTGNSEVFILANADGCDSLVTVSVAPFPTELTEVTGEACQGSFFEYMGTQIAPGETVVFTEINTFGCMDSTVVTVNNLVTSEDSLVLFTCPGDSAYFGGTTIPAGETEVVTFISSEGCDSVFVVTAFPLPTEYEEINEAACEGSFVEYMGTQIMAGETAIFTASNANGCTDSTVVFVDILNTSEGSENFEACSGGSVEYAGVSIPAGTSEVFIFENAVGCDSVVTVTVDELPALSSELSLEACEGSTVEYAGVEIAAGNSQVFTLVNSFGCDSVVTVFVEELVAAAFEYEIESACPNGLNGSISVTSILGGTPPMLFSLDGQPFQSATLFENVLPGEHQLSVLNSNGCEHEESVNLPAIPAMEVFATDQTMPCSGDLILTTEVNSTLPVHHLWKNEDGSRVVATEAFVVNEPGLYFYTLTNDCEVVAGNVEVFPGRGETPIYLPNAFSPNNNGTNDCYRGYTAPDVELLGYKLLIFDRKGDLVFETYELEGCWDGTLDGQFMNPAVFAFFMEAKLVDCTGDVVEIFEEGGVHLMR